MLLSDLLSDLEDRYPPSTAAEWDAVGLLVGDPAHEVHRVLLAVEATELTAAEAVELDADLLLVHHPLLLRGVTTIAETTAKGRVLTGLVRGGCALYAAHTNADDAPGGVSEALALAVGLDPATLRPLVPATHPAALPGSGTGRVGELAEPLTLDAFARRVAAALPATAQGVRIAGDRDALVRTVAVCGGSGDSFLSAAREAGVDVYLTADLRHHPATDFRAHAEKPYLLDAAHWASEWVWLPGLADQLRADAEARGARLEVHVSTARTDAWAASVGADPAATAAAEATDRPERPA
ncbi:Nif3-like dinuclear metal center hexameric protein [Miniimonas arenae]|uniref:GTP cyclohydrolase 1 type 2 homolog n=1 Tax=Miniimonas arenae TaxID=676201 RepID=A0A5C5BE93_9MICO|nr:Nif3-like dinuclear metal center hexameric protein [Miniimonas arenae]TNU76352.1 Nif3-like dinuclear metal center hexameric protein [Miniimonas arenae]